MKNLSSLTTFFITFLFVVYLGVFSGLKVNSFISDKKLVSASSVQIAVSPTFTPAPKPSTALAQKSVSSQTAAAVSTAAPVAPPVPPPPAADMSAPASTPPPALSVDMPAPPPPPPDPAPSVAPPSNRCIITISGGQYDVTEYRNIHSGGDIFQCGTDMTESFLSQHPSSFLQKMSKYRV